MEQRDADKVGTRKILLPVTPREFTDTSSLTSNFFPLSLLANGRTVDQVDARSSFAAVDHRGPTLFNNAAILLGDDASR